MHTSLTESQLQRQTDPRFCNDEAGAVLTVYICIRDVPCSILSRAMGYLGWGLLWEEGGVSPRDCEGILETKKECSADKRKSMIHSHWWYVRETDLQKDTKTTLLVQYANLILRDVRNAEVGTIKPGGRRMDQQLLPVPKHSVLTLQWLCKILVY
jgi:hypothetical protein